MPKTNGIKKQKRRKRNDKKRRLRKRFVNKCQNFTIMEQPLVSPTMDKNLIFYPVNKNVLYILVTDLKSIYSLQADLCCHLSLIAFSTKWLLYCDGYVADYNESITISTCFSHKTFIQLIDHDCIKTKKQNPSSIDLFKYSFLAENITSLIIGEYVLLKLEFDRKASSKYKLVLEYLSKSSNTNVNKICKRKFDMNFSDTKAIMFKEIKDDFLQFIHKIDLIYRSLEINSKDIILVCGPSNSGKTSLIHNLINRYISENKKSVVYLECDPGQTEFTPCGILSLVQINEKISNAIGYKFLFKENQLLSNPDRITSKIFGTISPASNSFGYISLIEQLYQLFSELKLNEPLFINTIGWIENLGLELLTRIISIVNPTHVIRIENRIIDVDFINKNITNSLGKYSNFQDMCQLLKMKKRMGFQFWITSLPIFNIFGRSTFSISYLKREVNQLLYFISNLWPKIIYKPFYSIEPIKISLQNMYIHFVNYPSVILQSIYDLLNVSWVFLGIVDPCENNNLKHITLPSSPNDSSKQQNNNDTDNKNEKMTPDQIKLVQRLPKSAVCLGCAVIRNVNMYESSIFLTMSASLNPERINLLVIPNLIPIPSGFLVEQFLYQNSCSLPYTYISTGLTK